MTVADLNQDGKQDLILANAVDSSVSILLGNGDGTFQARMDFAAGNTPIAVAAADFNGDGKLDLALSDHLGETVSILLGNGDGTFPAHVEYGPGTTWVFAAVA